MVENEEENEEESKWVNLVIDPEDVFKGLSPEEIEIAFRNALDISEMQRQGMSELAIACAIRRRNEKADREFRELRERKEKEKKVRDDVID